MKIRFGNDKNKHIQIKMSRKTEKQPQFKVGDYVFHECDAKKSHMLLHIDKIEPNGMVWATYIDKKFDGRRWHGHQSEIKLRSDVVEEE
jgi:hypothetical protein